MKQAFYKSIKKNLENEIYIIIKIIGLLIISLNNLRNLCNLRI